MQFKLSVLAGSVLVVALCSGAAVHHAFANSQDKPLRLAQAAPTGSAVQGTATAPAVKKKKVIGNNAGGTKAGGKKAVALSTGDCVAVGGKVITVTDNRCGSSGQYCRMPDTNAVCIDKKN
jgi:hypothetical protein